MSNTHPSVPAPSLPTRPCRARLQQQPHRFVDRQQQQSSGSREFQPRQSPEHTERGAGQMGQERESTRD
ncbi:MAG: hypothetical protein ABI893_07885 [Polaromonas sp.]|uniref:hypothetical protein n=1 Tax=Polaromonas sp. TaxID=1869339 RepID=UPI003267C733